MWISKKKFNELEKRIATLEIKMQEQQFFNENLPVKVIETINEETCRNNKSLLIV